jgi:hypothetical protein
MARALMLSLLVEQYGRLGDQFLKQYDHPWLVWDASTWSAPSLDGETRLGRLPSGPTARGAHALCFGLTFNKDAAQITVGRSSQNDVVVNDGTVSRQHVVLTRNAFGTWQVRPLPGNSGTRCGSRILTEKDVSPLVDRQTLLIGSVELTFFEPKTFLERLKDLVPPPGEKSTTG